MTEPDWRELLADITKADPLTSSTEGLDDGCFWCDAWPRYVDVEGERYNARVAEHKPWCPWVAAMRALGRDLGAHTVAVDSMPGDDQ